MYSFKNDYSEGCHSNILEALFKSNLTQEEGYGNDRYSIQAKELIKKKLDNPNSEIFFISAGTQANLIVISSLLKPYESVISAKTGHINVHEAGAIEATGHKIDYIDTSDGKLYPEQIEQLLPLFEDHHMVKPKLVYISNATELGTIYKRAELEKLSACCKKYDLYLFVDGARLGSALCAENNDLSLADLSKLTDVFYIGGTKNGALQGEAIVFNKSELSHNFLYHLKQRGALLAKGRFIGVQFAELFNNDLFFSLAQHANHMAQQLNDTFRENGYPMLTDSKTNQIFPILPNSIIEKLSKNFEFYIWKKIDAHTSVIRLVTSWATDQKFIDEFVSEIKG